jgi:hypothetical protein
MGGALIVKIRSKRLQLIFCLLKSDLEKTKPDTGSDSNICTLLNLRRCSYNFYGKLGLFC